MPLGRYFIFATSLLLVLLFLSDRYMPELAPEAAHADLDRSIIRIQSGHKWPSAVDINTSLRTITPSQATSSNVPANSQPLEALAQLPPPAPVAVKTEHSASMAKPGTAESRHPVKAARHPVKTAKLAVRRMASYQIVTDFRSAIPPGW